MYTWSFCSVPTCTSQLTDLTDKYLNINYLISNLTIGCVPGCTTFILVHLHAKRRKILRLYMKINPPQADLS